MYMQQDNNQAAVQQQIQHQQWTGGTQNMGAPAQGEQRVPQAFTSQSLAHLQNMQIPTNINSPYEVFQQNSSNCPDQYQQGQQVFQSGDNVYVQSYQCGEMKSEYQYNQFQNKNQSEYQMQQQNLQLYGQYENQFQSCVEQVQSEVGYQSATEQSGNQYQFFVPGPGHGQTLPETGPAQNFQFSGDCVQSGQPVVQMQQQETVHQQQSGSVSILSTNSQQTNLHQQYHPPQHQQIVQNHQTNVPHSGQQISHQQLISGGHILNAQQQPCSQGQPLPSHPHIITSSQSQIANPGNHTLPSSAQPHLIQGSNGQEHLINAGAQSIITNSNGQQIVTTGQSHIISGASAHPQFIATSGGQPHLVASNNSQPLFPANSPAPQVISNGGQQQLIVSGNSSQQQLIVSGNSSQPQLMSTVPSQTPSLTQGTILIPVQQPGQAPLPQMIATGNGQFLIIQPPVVGPQFVLAQNQPTVQTTQLLIQTPQGLVVQPIFTLPQQTMPQIVTIPQPPPPVPSSTTQPTIRIVPTPAQPTQSPQEPPPQPSIPQQRFVPTQLIEDRGKESALNDDKKGQVLQAEVQVKTKEDEEINVKTEHEVSVSAEEGDEEDKSDLEEIDSKEEVQKVLPPSTQALSIQMIPRNAVPQPIFINGGMRTILSGNPETPVPGQVLPLAQPDGTTQPFVVVAQNPAVQQMIMAPPPSQSPDSTEDAGQPTINQTNAHIVDGVDLEEIKEFAKAFKMRRLSLGLTQTQIGQALSATAGPAYSQSAICRFERLDITPKSAQKIRPVLERWMKEAEDKFKQGQRELVEFVRLPGLNKIRKRRTSFSPEAVGLLSQYFEINKHPTGTEVTRLAQQLGYEREVVRIWFCNRRQAMRNAAKFVGRGKNKQVTIPEKSSEATSSPEPSMEICESPEADASECLSPQGSTMTDGEGEISILPD